MSSIAIGPFALLMLGVVGNPSQWLTLAATTTGSVGVLQPQGFALLAGVLN